MSASPELTPRAETPRGRVPDFFVVGHPKSGTSALYRMLSVHPQIHMPRKEPSFFVPEILLAGAKKYPNGISDYMALFEGAGPDQLVGESTTWYLWSKTAAARIAEAQPGARIIAILREPASFLRSLHLQFLRSDVESEPDFRTAVGLEGERAQGRSLPRNSTRPQLLCYSEHVRYVEQLRRYETAFGAEQMLVLIYEDFRADNEGTVRQVQRFLGVADEEPVQAIEMNTAAGMRSPRLNGFVRSLYLGDAPLARAAKAAIKTVSSQRLRHGAISALRRAQVESPPPPDSEFMEELRGRFRGEVEALSDHLNRDLLTFWNYDRLPE